MATLDAAVPAALGGESVAVHRARVASRRLREVIPVLEAAPSAARAGTAVRRVTRALGPVRELDVAARLYAELAAATPVHALAHVTLERTLARQRATAIRAMRRALSPAHTHRRSAALDALALEAPDLLATEIAAAVTTRLTKRARRLVDALDTVGVLYDAERLHTVRIAVKQLRYALEIAGAVTRARTVTRLRQLRGVQELLGRAHDLHVLGGHVRAVEARIVTRSRPAGRELRRLASHIDDQCRELHAAFLGCRRALLALATALTAAPATARRRTAA